LQSRINKGSDNNLVTIDIKKVVEVHPNARDVKKEVLTTLGRSRKSSYCICSQGENKKLEGIKIVQKKANMNGIPKLIQ
jgi:hypothetical protein